MKLNDKLMELRKVNGWSQEELANKIGVSRQTISNWELGDTSPDTNKLIQLSEVFGKSIDEILDMKKSTVREKAKRNRKKILFIVFVIIIVLYFLVFIYKFTIINNINNKFEAYKNLENYSYKTFTYNQLGSKIKNARESNYFYRDGILKQTTQTGGELEAIFWVDYKNSEAIAINEKSKTFSVLDSNKMDDASNRIYGINPSVVYCRNSLVEKLMNALNPFVRVTITNNNYVIKYKGQTTKINKDTALPLESIYYDEETKEIDSTIYEFKVNQTTVEEVNKNFEQYNNLEQYNRIY